MSLRYAILSLLSRDALTGYDLTKRFETMVGFFWAAKHSQIYPELAQLSLEGLVTYEVITQVSKPNKKVYTLTRDGRASLEAWVASDAERRSVKDPLLMRIWSLGALPPQAGLARLRALQTELAQRLEQVEEALEGLAAPSSAGDRALGMRLVLDLGRRQYDLYNEWTAQAIATLEQAVATEPLS
ncbi:MAG: PadR family transcriptional regulator [Candidatus Sericytochromatia bacterium]|nr:PadR family transcriptional regulator [Candidatus Sericytochromatia bacterium]MEB3221453.1 PadR family transcriptional regulator [Candidatus Sericytochromatia bacterium]